MVSLQVDASQLEKLHRVLGHIKDGVPKALSPAINRALNKGRTEVKREIRKVYVIKAGDIPIQVKGSTRATLGGEIVLQQGMLGLDKFFYTPRGTQRRSRRPLFARVKVGGGGTIATGFSALGKLFRRVGRERLPIKRLLAIGAPIMATQPAVGPAVIKAMGETLDKRIDHEMKRVLASAGG